MKMAQKWKPAAVVVLCLFFLVQIVAAQGEGNVLVNTDPQGSLVELTGDVTVSGVSPVKFDRALSGQYRVTIIREGYENYRSTAYFSESKYAQLDITLKPKTRTKAFFRSLIIPGWGQRYYGSKTKSALFALGTLASAVSYVIVKDDYDSKVDTYNARKAAFTDAFDQPSHPPDYLRRLELEMWEAQEDADNAEGIVNVLTAVTVGIYAFNLLDSFLFFPDFTSYTEYKAITAVPEVSRDRVGINLSMRF